MEDRFKVGIITATHGLRGDVKVFPTTDDPKRFKKLKNVILDNGKITTSLDIESVKFFKQFVILKFKGIDDINDVEKYRKFELYVEREQAVRLNKDEYFIADLIGVCVFDENSNLIGKVADVYQTGANDVYEIEFDESFLYEGNQPETKNMLVPAIKECIKEIDIENNRMVINIMKGLI